MSDTNNRGTTPLKLTLLPSPEKQPRKTPVCLPIPLQCCHFPCSGISAVFIHGPPVHSEGFIISSNKGEKMHCPDCGSHSIQLRHVGKTTGGVIGATAGGFAGLEGASAGALIGSVVPVVGTIAGGILGCLFGACAGAVAGAAAGEKLDGTVFDEYHCADCDHTFNSQ